MGSRGIRVRGSSTLGLHLEVRPTTSGPAHTCFYLLYKVEMNFVSVRSLKVSSS